MRPQVLVGTAHRARALEEQDGGRLFFRALTTRRISDVPTTTVVRVCVPGREGDDALSKGWVICSTCWGMLRQGLQELRRRERQQPEGCLERSAWHSGLLGFSQALVGLRGCHALRDEGSRQLVTWHVWQFEEPGVEARFLVSAPW